MENIIVVKTFFDEQWDVEVYQESNYYKGLLKRVKSLFEYGLTEDELEDYINDLKEKYNIIKEEVNNDLTGEGFTFPTYEKKEPFKERYEMYRFKDIEEFTSFVEITFLEKHQIEISLEVEDEEGSLYLIIQTKEKEEIKNMYDLNGREDEDIPVEDIVLEEVFGRPVQTSISFGETLVYYEI